jgi:hypothetical protein
MKIPIVPTGPSAIPETVEKWDWWEEYNPEFIAASMDRLVQDKSLRLSLGKWVIDAMRMSLPMRKSKADFFDLLKHENLIT